MYTRLMLSLVLVPAAWLQALQYPSGEESKPPSAPAGIAGLQGCLEYDSGVYSLLGDDGVKYRLAGAGKQLKGHVGHEVELTGKPASRSQDNTPPGGASNVITYYVFEVKNVRHVALTCKAQ
jgi:hypothetical protein